MKLKTVALLFATVVALQFTGSAQAPKHQWTISLRRAGPVRIGMSLSEVRRVLGDPRALLSVADPDLPAGDNGCTYLESSKLSEHLGLMFMNRRVVRVEVDDRSAAQTVSGARVGDTEERIKALYPRQIRVERHHYDPDGHYLIYKPSNPADRQFEIVFETDGKRVTTFRVGLLKATALIEGCS